MSRIECVHERKKGGMAPSAGGVCNGGARVEVSSEFERGSAVRVGFFSIFACLAKIQCL